MRKAASSNYSIIFSFWDRIHKTVRLNINQNKIITGAPSYADDRELTISILLKLPFLKLREPEAKANSSVFMAGEGAATRKFILMFLFAARHPLLLLPGVCILYPDIRKW